jgi:glycosyltransferase involved in cell wall biosynthesis
MRIGYLNTEYPSLSHTFIEREIRAVRSSGIEVIPFSIRRPADESVRGALAESARSETSYVLGGSWAIVGSFCRLLLRRSAGVLAGIVLSQRLSGGGLAARFRHLAYAIEGVRLADLAARAGVQHLHVHMANNGAAVAMLACEVDRRLSYSLTIHGSAEFFDVHRLRLAPKAEGAVFVRCISNFCKAQVMAWSKPEAWDRFVVIPTGIEAREFSFQSEGRNEDEGPGPLRLIAIGRLHPIKGYHLLIEALDLVRRDGHDVTLAFVGDGPTRSSLERLVRERRLEAAVEFLGARPAEDVPAILAEADALVVSSFMEGVPTVLMEAMAAGRLVLSTRVGGVPEILGASGEACSGFVVDPGSSEALAAGVIDILKTSSTERAVIRRRARLVIEQKYNVGANAIALARVFSERLGDLG